MSRTFRLWGILGLGIGLGLAAQSLGILPDLFPFTNDSGIIKTHSTTGSVNLTGAFFQSLGTNGRTCNTCHQAGDDWTISAGHVADRFEASAGLDPIFRTNDGSNCDHNIDTSTLAGRRQAYSLLTSRGLIRIALPVPAGAEFEVVSVSNPYGCNETSTLSFYRRPLPTTSLRFLSTLMWDGRESSAQTGTQEISYATNPGDLLADLAHQSVDATLGHAQAATPPTPAQQQDIVAFEMALSTAQAVDRRAGALDSGGATGGPVPIASQPFFVGINDPVGQNPLGTPFTPVVFTLYTPWADVHFRGSDPRASIVRGQELFNSRRIDITGVSGLNDDLGMAVIPGTCGTCHDTPNIGNHSFPMPVNIGAGDLSSPLSLSYLPQITVRKIADPSQTVTTTDLGRAMITGKWKDLGRLKAPILRGLEGRSPYFHNGSALELEELIHFYDVRFNIGLTAQEKEDLVAFLKAL